MIKKKKITTIFFLFFNIIIFVISGCSSMAPTGYAKYDMWVHYGSSDYYDKVKFLNQSYAMNIWGRRTDFCRPNKNIIWGSALIFLPLGWQIASYLGTKGTFVECDVFRWHYNFYPNPPSPDDCKKATSVITKLPQNSYTKRYIRAAGHVSNYCIGISSFGYYSSDLFLRAQVIIRTNEEMIDKIIYYPPFLTPEQTLIRLESFNDKLLGDLNSKKITKARYEKEHIANKEAIDKLNSKIKEHGIVVH